MRTVFLLLPGVHLLDIAGPAQVLSTAAEHGMGFEVGFIAESGVVVSAQGLSLTATTQWPDLTANDLIIVPGWRGATVSRAIPARATTLAALAAHHSRGGTVGSICVGADALGRAGLLDGRECTTHHEFQDELARRYPAAEVVRDVLFTVDDRVITSAGVASGIDLALHLVESRHGTAAAARVARELVLYARRNGDATQHSVLLQHRAHLNDVVHRAQDIIERDFRKPLPLTELAHAAAVSTRTLTRAFTHATGMTPLRYQQALRLEHAEQLITAGASVETASRLSGFGDPRMLRRLRQRETEN